MIDTGDIRAAVGAGVLSEQQAAALTALAHSRTGARENLAVGDEPFELFRGFNEIFIMTGLIILAAGWAGVVAWSIADQLSQWKSALTGYCLISAGLVWLLSEYFIRRRRMVGPAILLSVMFAGVATLGFVEWQAQVFMIAREDYSSLIFPVLLSIGAMLVYWLRFRVPFAMAIMAVGVFAAALLAASTSSGTPTDLRDIFVFSAHGGFAWITLALGLAIFALAMMFDGSDPHRVTRRSAQGFWLHLVASPMIINTVAMSLLDGGTERAAPIILALMGFFGLVAVVIDRRSFLLAAIAYVVTVIAALNPITQDVGFAGLILGLGLFLVLLGAFWARIRATLISAMPLGGLRRFLPPAH